MLLAPAHSPLPSLPAPARVPPSHCQHLPLLCVSRPHLCALSPPPALQARALDSVLKEINSRFGKNSIMKLGTNSYGEV